MILSRRVSFHDAQLDQVAPEIVILSVDRGAPKENITAADRMGGYGQRLTGSHWQTLDATVTFGIDVPRTKPQRRVSLFESVRNWACGTTGKGTYGNGGWLTISMSGRNQSTGITIVGGVFDSQNVNTSDLFARRRLYVDKVIFPSSADIMDWTAEYTITFRAFNVPFWQDITPVTGSVTKLTYSNEDNMYKNTIYLDVNGTMRTPVDMELLNTSGKEISTIRIQTGVNRIDLNNLGLKANETLVISHGTNGLLSIKVGTVSKYGKYSGDDDLLISPGNQRGVTVYSERAGLNVSAKAYGRYL